MRIVRARSLGVVGFIIEKRGQGRFHHRHVHVSVETGPEWPVVEYAENRDRITVLDPAGQIPFTGNRDDHVRFLFYHDPTGERTSRCNRDGNPMPPGQLAEVLDSALPAPLALGHIRRDPDPALVVLETVGQEDEKSFRSDLLGLRKDEPVVDGDKGPANLVLADTEAPAHPYEQREKDADDHPPDFPVEEEIPPPDDGHQERQGTPEAEKHPESHEKGQDPRQARMDICKPHIGDPPKDKREPYHDHTAHEQEEDKDPLAGRIRVLRSSESLEINDFQAELTTKSTKYFATFGRNFTGKVLLWYSGRNQFAIRMVNIEQGISNDEGVSGNPHFDIGYATFDIPRFTVQFLRKSQRSFTQKGYTPNTVPGGTGKPLMNSRAGSRFLP